MCRPCRIVVVAATISFGILTGPTARVAAEPPRLENASMNVTNPDPAQVTRAEQSAVDASNAFGLDLYRALAAESRGGNLFMSPYSVSVALTMAAEGAAGQTAEEMVRVLHIPEGRGTDSMALEPVHEGHAAMRDRFREAAGQGNEAIRRRIDTLRKRLADANEEAEAAQGAHQWDTAGRAAKQANAIAAELNPLLTQVDRFELRSANALWVDRQFPLLKEYIEAIERYYGSDGATSLDIRHETEAARLRINGWVEENTEHRIKDLIPKGAMTSDTGLVITNAIYFLGQWAEPFEKDDTREEDFTQADGQRRKAKLMQDRWRKGVPYAAFNADGSFFKTPSKVPSDGTAPRPACYPEDDGFSMIELPYKGGELAMTVIAPRRADHLPSIEKLLNADMLASWLSKLEARSVHVAMPRFKLEANYEMSQSLQAMGMQRAFRNPALAAGAEFSGMSRSDDPSEQLFIGMVLHKAWVDVNEAGTEAAAATAVMMVTGAAAPDRAMVPFVPEFRADRPFLFLIRDRQTGVVLFIGRVMQPDA